jgi:molybdopterin converting factor small subunit
MKLKLICYGITKDIIGDFEREMEVDDVHTIGDLKLELMKQFPDFVRLTSLRIAINTDYAEDESVLKENDEVVLIPPVSGG